jgi:hypothetical protein
MMVVVVVMAMVVAFLGVASLGWDHALKFPEGWKGIS